MQRKEKTEVEGERKVAFEPLPGRQGGNFLRPRSQRNERVSLTQRRMTQCSAPLFRPFGRIRYVWI